MSKTRRDEILDRLREYESPNVTYLPEAGRWPIVWERAKGMKVWDVEGNEYLDLTAAFGVAAAGHAAPAVVRAGRVQMGRLLHAMGDVHPHELKALLAERLSGLTFGRWLGEEAENGSGKVVFCNSGFEAVEVALKGACQATGRHKIVSFEDAYHGLGYGALAATHRDHFRGRFGRQISAFAQTLPFPVEASELGPLKAALGAVLKLGDVGAVLVEPIQGRGGIKVPPPGFLRLLREACDEFQCLLVLDEIYTGFGRTGDWFACEAEAVVPDFVCLGKALTGGFPLSALVGRADLMDQAWPKSTGEAIHTSTYLGHPVGCAMAMAQIDLLERRNLVRRSARMGKKLRRLLGEAFGDSSAEVMVRGRGLMLGVEFLTSEGQPDGSLCLGLIEALLEHGYILLPDGEFGQVMGITPPLVITTEQIHGFVDCLRALYLKVRRS